MPAPHHLLYRRHFGLSDPLACVRWNGLDVGRTRAVKKSTSPAWDESFQVRSRRRKFVSLFVSVLLFFFFRLSLDKRVRSTLNSSTNLMGAGIKEKHGIGFTVSAVLAGRGNLRSILQCGVERHCDWTCCNSVKRSAQLLPFRDRSGTGPCLEIRHGVSSENGTCLR